MFRVAGRRAPKAQANVLGSRKILRTATPQMAASERPDQFYCRGRTSK